MYRIGLNEDQKILFSKNKIEFNKGIREIQKEARKQAKLDYCFSCKKACTTFCKSHSVPKFCLKRIAPEGKVFISGLQNEIPSFGPDTGIGEAGTFFLICKECDGKLFQDYENPCAYSTVPTGKVLAQIAMKNYLQMIAKRLQERSLYSLAEKSFPSSSYFHDEQLIIQLDLQEYIPSYRRAQIAARGHHDTWFYPFYFRSLDYVVPYASQSPMVLVTDFEGNIVNNVYNLSPDYHTKDIHVAVFPLENSSAVILFVDSGTKRYRQFYKQLHRLQPDDQLAAINYLIFCYTENVFLSKKAYDFVVNNPTFKDVCRKSLIAKSPTPNPTLLKDAVAEFDLSKRNQIPNLLSREFAL